jgi:hypothetical protein
MSELKEFASAALPQQARILPDAKADDEPLNVEYPDDYEFYRNYPDGVDDVDSSMD